MTWVLIAVVTVALIFDFTNGFHDAANAIATSIGTRALRPATALTMAAVLNIVGGVIYPTSVANTMTQIVSTAAASQELVLAALLGAIAWNLVTWHFGIPSSSSHALIGGLVGAAVSASWSIGAVQWHNVAQKVIIPTIASPVIGFIVAALVTSVLYRLVNGGTGLLEVIIVRALAFLILTAFWTFILNLIVAEPAQLVGGIKISWKLFIPTSLFDGLPFRDWIAALPGWTVFTPFGGLGAWAVMRGVIGRGPAEVNGRFRLLQTLSAGFMALEHGHNDAQKTMGIITLALVAAHRTDANAGVPLWVKLACATVIGLGTFSGGKRIIKTMGMKLVKLEPIDGFAAETVAASVINVAGSYGMPISTTHAITAAITGVGATKRISAVKWGITGQILSAWVLTLPAAAFLSGVAFWLLRLFSFGR
jgi:PiT family inorganic phosphate transporter